MHLVFEHYLLTLILNRIVHRAIDNPISILEFKLQKVRILTIPNLRQNSEWEVIQYSKYDTVKSLYNRLINPENSENYLLCKIMNQGQNINRLIQKIKDTYSKNWELDIDRKIVISSDENVMSLGLDDNSLLIIENLELKGRSIWSEYYRSSKNYLLDSKGTQNRNVESWDSQELSGTNFIFDKKNRNAVKRERRKSSK